MLNSCVESGRISNAWKQIKITALPKTSPRKVIDVKKNHPIGQTSALVKVFEHYLKKELEEGVKNNEQLYDRHQFSYKQYVSTVGAVNAVIDDVKLLGQGEGHRRGSAFGLF